MAKRIKDPRQIAIKGVADWFDVLSYAADHEERNPAALEKTVAAVLEALEAEHIKAHGPIGEDEPTQFEILAQEAGFMVGVQVGLRLREAR